MSYRIFFVLQKRARELANETELKRGPQMAFTPVWAQVIELKREGDALLIRGWGHVPFHVNASDVDPQHVSGIDLLEQFRRTALSQLSSKQEDVAAGIYQLADADDDDKLVAFVRRFGPIVGSVLSEESDREFGTKTLTVREDLASLRHHQKVFSAATKLLAELNRNGLADSKAIVHAMMILCPAPRLYLPQHLPDEIARLAAHASPGIVSGEFYPWVWSMLAVRELIHVGDGRAKVSPRAKQHIREYGHHAFCQLLNAFPLVLFPALGDRPIELPKIKREGIIDSLYYKLRLDYLAQRQLGICLNCNAHFPIMRRGARACSEACARALRNRKYWKEHNKTINKKRPKKGR